MTRRDWVIAVGAGVCGCLAPACTRTLDVGKGVGPREPALIARVGPERLPASEPASPYNPIPGIPMPREAESSFGRVAGQEVKPDGADGSRGSAAIGLGAPGEVKDENSSAGPSEKVTAARPPEEAPLVGALRCFLDKHPDDALEKLKGYEKANQELLLTLLPLMARLGEGSLRQASPQEINALVEGLDSLIFPLRTRAPLTINKMCFCKSIKGFGDYEPLPDYYRFRPGERVRIYVELQNFTSHEQHEATGEVRHVINLVSTAEIRDYSGNKVWSEEIVFQRQGADASRTLRHDYCDNYGFWVPEEIPPGSYTLWIQVADRDAQPARTVRGSLDFHVAIPVHGS
jgi:hypothetical protein